MTESEKSLTVSGAMFPGSRYPYGKVGEQSPPESTEEKSFTPDAPSTEETQITLEEMLAEWKESDRGTDGC
jgi:hypothetical protein